MPAQFGAVDRAACLVERTSPGGVENRAAGVGPGEDQRGGVGGGVVAHVLAQDRYNVRR
ncbi:hypothetical protein [Rhodococcus sp. MS13]|uniref:hypothetical protein n=1 Tax=Rhodococcus sp. MS13 TaxID=2579940 RepID=UPI001F5B60B6|nr:hypothetical protein [Rhodococcus sp. MS13]